MNRHWSDSQDGAAQERGADKLRFEPRATSARYETRTRRIVVELTNGASFAFAPELVEGLAGEGDRALSAITIEGVGFTLHWPDIDVDYSVGGLINGVFGTARWMAALAGKGQSAKKAAAARANGRKGGRPRKATPAPLGKSRLVTAEAIALEYGLNPKSYRSRLREARLGWHEANARWEVDPASAEQKDMLTVAEEMRARQREEA